MFGRRRLCWILLALAFLANAASVASCTSGGEPMAGASPDAPAVQTTPEAAALAAPSPTPEALSELINPVSRVSPSVEEQAFASDFIVRASLISATASTETAQSGPGVAPTYRALQLLRFTAHEYLKGNGPNEIVVIVRGRHTYITQSEARVFADLRLMQRKTAWDDRQGVLFLNNSSMPVDAQGQNETAFEFNLSNYGVETEWDYAIDTLSRAWLPATEPSAAAIQEFIADGSASPPAVVSLAELRYGIAEMEDTLAAGAGVEGFTQCIRDKLLHERYRRAVPYTPFQHLRAIQSGLPAGTEIYRHGPFFEDPTLFRSWFTGTHSRSFQSFLEYTDSNPRDGYDRVIAILRPLPEGRYEFEYRVQHYLDAPCGFMPEPYSEGTVAVGAPDGTLHEALFDPGASVTAVGYTENAGTLELAVFSIDGITTTIQALEWEDGVVTMELTPAVSLAEKRMDFIALDGSVTLSLSFDDAQTRDGDGTLTWNVPQQPWHDGDRLMIRIRDAEQ